MRSFKDIVERVGLWSLSLSWQDAFDAYELKRTRRRRRRLQFRGGRKAI